MAITTKKTTKNGGKGKIKPRWKKGQSGNPRGRPRESAELKNFKAWAKEECKKPDFQKDVRKLAKKNPKAAEMILHYGEGRPPEKVEHIGKVGGLIVLPAQITSKEEWNKSIAPFLGKKKEGS